MLTEARPIRVRKTTMKRQNKLAALILAAALTVSFYGCGSNGKNHGRDVDEVPGTRATTTKAAEIESIPKEKKELIALLDSAIDYLEIYGYSFDKSVVCEVGDVNTGALSAVSNSAQAFRSVFGERSLYSSCDYSSAPETYNEALLEGSFEERDVETISAEKKGDKIIISAVFPDVPDPDEGFTLGKIEKEFVTKSDVKEALGEFSSSAASCSADVSDIRMTVQINAADSKPESLKVSFVQNFSLTSVKLVENSGSAVYGTSSTEIEFSNIN